jgi:hypothetical protein
MIRLLLSEAGEAWLWYLHRPEELSIAIQQILFGFSVIIILLYILVKLLGGP